VTPRPSWKPGWPAIRTCWSPEDELLRYVHFEPEALRAAYRRKLSAAGLSARARSDAEAQLEAGLAGYTYLLES